MLHLVEERIIQGLPKNAAELSRFFKEQSSGSNLKTHTRFQKNVTFLRAAPLEQQ